MLKTNVTTGKHQNQSQKTNGKEEFICNPREKVLIYYTEISYFYGKKNQQKNWQRIGANVP